MFPMLGTPPPARGPPDPAGVVWLVARNTPACAGTTLLRSRSARPHTEHPRLRGDHVLMPGHQSTRNGTPPPARGPQRRRPHVVEVGRNTPACAGTTSGAASRSPGTVEHPRLRGDHAPDEAFNQMSDGTPPPARGPLVGLFDGREADRNTPACAGTTWSRLFSSPSAAEHPRLRGDHEAAMLLGHCAAGTPPPARGPRVLLRLGLVLRRNTPACAGTTSASRRRP